MPRFLRHDGPRRPRRRSPVLLVCFSLTAYFGYHAIQGRHGLEARSRLINRSAQLERAIGALETVRARYCSGKSRCSMNAPPDPGYIDELARTELGFARAGDHLIIERRAARTGR
ncbi:MAG: septum formation initiator family protein [Hyphomicrobiaceae bacterium]